MFLTKKNTPAQKKPIKNTRALGGWDDNDDDNHSGNKGQAQYTKMSNPNNTATSNCTSSYSSYSNTKNEKSDLISCLYRNPVDVISTNGNNPASQTQKKQVHNFYFVDELSQMQNIQCECKAVEDVLIPGGIRVRQNDSVLSQFFNEVKSLDISVIGSLLVCQLYNEDFEVKAKSLYAIEYLVKKNIQYSVYFKLHADKIQDSPSCNQNEETYLKIKKGLLTTLGVEIMKPEERRQLDIDLLAKQGITYEDPGYSSKEEPNDLKGFLAIGKKQSDKQKDNKQKVVKKFISPSDAKKKTLSVKKQLSNQRSEQNSGQNSQFLI